MKKLKLFAMLSFFSLGLVSCRIGQSSDSGTVFRLFALAPDSSQDSLYLSISGNLSQDGESISNTLLVSNASGITTQSYRQTRSTTEEAIRCIDYNLSAGRLTCVMILKTADVSASSDSCYQIFYGSASQAKVREIAKFQNITYGNEIKFALSTELPTNVSQFELYSCNSEGVLATANITDYSASSGVISDSSGTYTINLQAGQKYSLDIRRTSKDLGSISIDLSEVLTAEEMAALQAEPSKLQVTLPDGIEQSIVILGAVQGTAETSTASSTGSSAATAGATIDINTLTVESSNDSAISDSPPSDFTYPTSSYSLTQNASVSITPSFSGIVSACSISPSLPQGLALSTSSCAIVGTPAVTLSSTNYTITASNASGSATASISLAIAEAAPANLIYTGSPYTFTQNAAISTQSPTVSGSITSCSISPSLPSGLALDSSNCSISGTPTTTLASTNYTVTASNAIGSTSTMITITVNVAAPSGLTYTSSNVYYILSNAITSNTVASVSGSGLSYSVSPALPTGLSLNTSNGTISGTPTSLQSATSHTITASNVSGSTSAAVSIAVVNSGCSGSAVYSYQIASDLYLCAITNNMAQSWTEVYSACENASGFYMATVLPMTRRGLPTDAQISTATSAATAAGFSYIVTGQSTRGCLWTSGTGYESCNGLGYIALNENSTGSNWQALVDGNETESRNWPSANSTNAGVLISLCQNASSDGSAYIYDYRWR
ncbi:MAG: Ig domain-containing protein [Spirochaetota bacterium]